MVPAAPPVSYLRCRNTVNTVVTGDDSTLSSNPDLLSPAPSTAGTSRADRHQHQHAVMVTSARMPGSAE
jgi:hypothetical protein